MCVRVSNFASFYIIMIVYNTVSLSTIVHIGFLMIQPIHAIQFDKQRKTSMLKTDEII